MVVKSMLNPEHQAWLDMFDEIKRTFGLSTNELNQPKYRKIFEFIERWAYFDREDRKINKDRENFKGVLWNGEW